jgi:hypothetical protein
MRSRLRGRNGLTSCVLAAAPVSAACMLDTVGFRAGDAGGAQIERCLAELGLGLTGLSRVVLPIALLWAALSLLLGRVQSRLVSGKTHRSA